MSSQSLCDRSGSVDSPVSPAWLPLEAPRWVAYLAAAAIAVAAWAAYGNSFLGPFLADDLGAIVDNPTLRHLSSALSPPRTGTPVEGRPLLNLSLAVNYAIGGTRVGSYHMANLLIHVLAGITLFGIVRRTLAQTMSRRRSGQGALGQGAQKQGGVGQEALQEDWRPAAAIAFAAALLWTVHPLQTEAVTYLSQRAESLMGLLYLVTLYAFIRSVEGGPAAKAWAFVSMACCYLGMASKEVMVTAPLMVLLYDRTFVAGSFRESWRCRRGFLLVLGGSWLLLGVLMQSSASRAGTMGFGTAVPWWAYALTQFRAVAHYLRLSLWPSPLVADYGRALGGPPFEVAWDALLVGLLVAASIILLARRSPWGFLGAWFFLILAPTSSVIPVATEIIAERRAYLSSAAVCVAGVLAIMTVSGWRVRRAGGGGGVPSGFLSSGLAPGLGLCVVLACGLGVLTARRNAVYRTAMTFWTDVALKVPNHAGAQNNLGNLLLEQGRLGEAEDHYRQALRWVPSYADAHANLGNLLLKQGRLEDAIAQYEAALPYRPNDPKIRQPLGTACYRLGNSFADSGRLAPAAEAYGTAVRMLPNLADAHVDYGIVLARLGRVPQAMQELQTALKLDPAAADVHNNLGSLLARSGQFPEAKAQFEEAIRLRPDYEEARDNLRRVNLMDRTEARP